MDNDYLLGCDVLGAYDDEVFGDLEEVLGEKVTYTDAVTVRAVQTALKARNFDPGKIDGVFGPKTSDAIKKLQASLDVEQVGLIDYSVLMLLNVPAPSDRAPAAVARMGSPSAPAAQGGLVLSSTPTGTTSWLQQESLGGMKRYQIGLASVGLIALLGGLTAALRR